MIKIKTLNSALHFFTVSLLIGSTIANAQVRGGSCRGELCQLSGGVIGLLLLGALLISVAQSIHRHGFWSGMLKHAGVQFLLVYVGTIGGLIFIFTGAKELWGKDGAILAMVAVMFVLWRLGDRKIPKQNDTEDENA